MIVNPEWMAIVENGKEEQREKDVDLDRPRQKEKDEDEKGRLWNGQKNAELEKMNWIIIIL